MSTPDIERPDIVEQARAALSDWHEACARMDEVDADPDLEHEDRRHAQDIVTEAALETAWLMADLVAEADRLRGQLDRARDFAARLEAENARLTEALYLTRITLEATFRVLQEASGLPDDIDDPDCRDEMVLALRPRAEKAEAENARLVDRIERLSAEYEADLPESMAGDERLRRVFDDHANDVLGLLSDEDEGGE